MTKDDIVRTIKNRSVRDYTYAIMFFLVSAFFAAFVIRPVLSIAIGIQREASDLERINKVYEKNITKVLELQSQLEDLRPRKHVLDEALPSDPQINAVIADIQSAAVESGVPIKSLKISPVELKTDEEPQEEDKDVVTATLFVSSSFDNIEALLRAIANQRRVKSVNNVSMSLSRSSEGTLLSLEIELDSFYISDSGGISL